MPGSPEDTSEEIKLAIIGGRDFVNYQKMCDSLADIEDRVSLVITGRMDDEHHGTRELAVKWAEERGIEWVEFVGVLRNAFIAKSCTHLVAFVDVGLSEVTLDVIQRAKNHKKRYRVVNY